MGTTKVPEKYEHKCDDCGTTLQTNTATRPQRWGTLILEQGAVDFQGAEVADGSIRRLLCPGCKRPWAEQIAAIGSKPVPA